MRRDDEPVEPLAAVAFESVPRVVTPLALEVESTADVAATVARLERTEDVLFSPDGRRLAVAGFGLDVIFCFEVAVDSGGGAPRVALLGVTELASPALHDPHGLVFVDDDLLAVANRGGDLLVLRLPRGGRKGHRRVEVEAELTIDSGGADGIFTPGSVTSTRVAADLHELLVCNNYAHTVTRHVVDTRPLPRVVGSETLLAAGLAIPDGVTVSHDGTWIAVSNHDTHAVLLYRRDEVLGPSCAPDGELELAGYPHGIRFTPDDRAVLVADAGTPFVHVYERTALGWAGRHRPVRSVRVLGDESFLRTRPNPQEGGPKGIAIDPSGAVVAVTTEGQPLAFFALAEFVHPGGGPGPIPLAGARAADRTRRVLVLRAYQQAAELRARAGALETRIAEQDALLAAAEAGHHDQVVTVEALQQRAGELEKALAARESECTELASRLVEMEARLRRDAAVEQHQHAVADDLARRLAAVHASRSWRLTAPLRWVGGRVRRR